MKNLKVRHKLDLVLVLIVLLIAGSASSSIKGMSELGKRSNATLEAEARTQYDNQIKQQVENAISMLAHYYSMYEAGECSLDEAKKQGADMRVTCVMEKMAISGQMIPKAITLFFLEAKPKAQTV